MVANGGCALSLHYIDTSDVPNDRGRVGGPKSVSGHAGKYGRVAVSLDPGLRRVDGVGRIYAGLHPLLLRPPPKSPQS